MIRKLISLPGLLIPESVLFGRKKKSVYSFFYHHVSDADQGWLKPFYRSLSSIEFRKELAYLLKYFDPVSIEKLNKILIGQEVYPSGKPLMHISFDDGLKSCRETIAPILLEMGIPATFFVNPAFIDNKDLFYRYKIGLLLWQRPNISLAMRKHLLNMNHTDTDELNLLLEKYGLDYHKFLINDKPYLQSGDLEWLNDHGFSLGAHSIDHPDFRLLNEQTRKRQVTESMKWIENHFPQRVKTFSFPFTDFGMSADFIHWMSQQCDVSFGCAGLKKDILNTHLQRLAMDEEASSIKYRLKKAFFLGFLQSLAGANTVNR